MQKYRKRIKANDTETLIGKLNHVCFVAPDARHLMNNLRKMEKNWPVWRRKSSYLEEPWTT